jgi:hypothetical protein
MKKVKLFIGQTYSTSEDEYAERIKGDIQDWTELSDDEYKNLTIHKSSIERNLRDKGLIGWNENLVIIRETSDEEVSAVKLDLKEIINTVAKQEGAKREKEKKRLQKIQKTNEERKKAKELAQLKKLQEKYGEK